MQISRHVRRCSWCMIVMAILLTPQLVAQNPPSIDTGSNLEEVVVETVWTFSRTIYETPIETGGGETAACAQTPEEAARAQSSAVLDLDFDRWLAGHDEISQEALLSDEARAKAKPTSGIRTREGWLQGWEREVLPNQILLTSRAETPNFVVITFEMQPRSATKTSLSGTLGTMTFVESDGCWLQTRRFAAHPVPSLLNTEEKRLRTFGRY